MDQRKQDVSLHTFGKKQGKREAPMKGRRIVFLQDKLMDRTLAKGSATNKKAYKIDSDGLHLAIRKDDDMEKFQQRTSIHPKNRKWLCATILLTLTTICLAATLAVLIVRDNTILSFFGLSFDQKDIDTRQRYNLTTDNLCDLDNDLNCIFTQDTDDDYDWTRHSGSTESPSTGPTAAYEGSYYFYFEASEPGSIHGVARLRSRIFRLASTGCLKFYYHMYGKHMGQLKVYEGENLRWKKSGNQGNKWHSASVDLYSDASNITQVTFEAIKGDEYSSDIAIDYVRISSSGC